MGNIIYSIWSWTIKSVLKCFMFIVDVLKCFTKIMRFLIPIFTGGSMKKDLIESNNCHEIAYKHFYTSRICILNGISLPTQSTYFPHKNPEMAINISIYIWHLRAFDGLFTVKRKGEVNDKEFHSGGEGQARHPVRSPPKSGETSSQPVSSLRCFSSF